jgi:deoxyribodipyrimidine photo-lyase
MKQPERVKKLNTKEYKTGSVVFYPVRDLRVQDNYALAYAQELALEHNAELRVVFVLYPNYLGACERQYEFVFEGLEEFEADLRKLNIPFEIRLGDDIEQIDILIKEGTGAIVTDYSPLRRNQGWKHDYAAKCMVPLYEVDAHNVIPVEVTSPKQEFAAYTIRPKIYKLVASYLVEPPQISRHKYNTEMAKTVDWQSVRKLFKYDHKVSKTNFLGGERAAHIALNNFLENRLKEYSTLRNDPNEDFQSDLSPYITFGFISRTRIALEVCRHQGVQIQDILEKDKNAAKGGTSAAAFVEELIIRAELAENFCHYNKNYDNPDCFADWAKKSHEKHRGDVREFLYTLEEFEKSETHDPLWNAAQNQMLQSGKMHGYMRMYWAKKVFEWTKDVDQAMEFLVYLNDTYSLDGRDSNGYAGIAWSVGGVHDRAWFEREVFGQIRYMNYNGCKRKFDVKKYETTWNKQNSTQKELF